MTKTVYNQRHTLIFMKESLAGRAKVVFIVCSVLLLGFISPARAANDLLVAPTRLVFDNRTRSAEVILSNIGVKAATYRISLVTRRMTEDGSLEDVEVPNAIEARARDMISYAPRHVVLEPNRPQSIRVAVRKPADLVDGEYRVHMLFRAVPDAAPLVASADVPVQGFAIKLIPIYGITIPIVVRHGKLQARAAIANPHVEFDGKRQMIAFDLKREGDRSVYGEVRVLKPGIAEPVILAKGISVYTEVGKRRVALPVRADYIAPLRGPATVQYFEVGSNDERILAAEAKVDLK